MPQTVPNRPTKGAEEATVARKVWPYSRRDLSWAMARFRARVRNSSGVPASTRPRPLFRARRVLLDGGEAVVHQVREGFGDAGLAQVAGHGVEAGGGPEGGEEVGAALLRADRLGALGDDQVPGADRHDQHQREDEARDAVGAGEEVAEAEWVSMVSPSV
jgi:hypothetical protein